MSYHVGGPLRRNVLSPFGCYGYKFAAVPQAGALARWLVENDLSTLQNITIEVTPHSV